MIEVVELVKLYGDRVAINGLNFSAMSGRICGLLGPNGSGKSTTMDIIAGLLGPSAGTVKVCGFDVVQDTTSVKSLVGYLPDNPPLYRDMIVRDFIRYVATLRGIRGKKALDEAVDSILAECDVEDVASRIINNLSKGYRQRVALCAALVHKPPVLILDEPTEGLDPNQILHIRNLIKKLAKDRTVILSSHILSEVQATCQDVVIINQGHIATKISLDAHSLKETRYLYTFAQGSESAINWFRSLREVTMVKSVLGQNETIIVEFDKEFCIQPTFAQKLSSFTQELAGKNLAPVGIMPKKEGLEEIFFDVLKNQQNISHPSAH